MSREEWEAIEANQRATRRSVNYTKRVCPLCRRVISEGAYTGKAGNFKKHVAACEKRKAEENQ